ncbi:UDP-glucose dehydrogenase family protein [Sungkyunkwania multivorans]|uniref:UDP-glucose 6-dehydrogenase n=1 Tax=Sungkyunkwania multivorans TaxID=1173618 RepID=A0ABW3CZ60_9FLAO
MKITVIGTGYVGLVTGTCLAETGNDVLCVDINEEKVNLMKKGKVPIYEPQLEVLFAKNIKSGRLNFTTSIKEGLDHGTIIFLALPTPEDEDGAADLSYVLGVAEDIGKMITDYKVIVGKSTVPVGTADLVRKTISKHTDQEFDVVSNPEFLREGYAVGDFLKPERIIIGTDSERAIQLLKKIYKPYTQMGSRLLIMDEKSSELTKYASNSFLATKITFINEVANFCERVGADVDMVRIGMGADSRIGNRFLFPGIGYGGSCFPKDVKALHKSGKEEHYNFKLLEAVIDVNRSQKVALVPKIMDYFGGALKGKKIAIWGLAFKPETDDIREASSLDMIRDLLKLGADIVSYDPEAMPNVKRKLGNKISFAKDMYTALEDAEALVICTEWSIFKLPDFKRMKKQLKTPVIFDGRNLYDLQEMKSEGFYYSSIGRPVIH